MKGIQDSNLAKLTLAAGLLVGIQQFNAEFLLPPLKKLPIVGMQTTKPANGAGVQDIKTLPLLISNIPSRSAALTSPNDIIAVDAAFIPPPPAAPMLPAVPQMPDFFSKLQHGEGKAAPLKLQAITDEGAILNGQFYSFGQAMADYAYPTDAAAKRMRTPILRRHTATSIRVHESPGKRFFTLALEP